MDMSTSTLSFEAQRELLNLIRGTLRARLTGRATQSATPPGSDELRSQAGCFVTLHRHRDQKLRGCIGRLDASQPLWLAAVEMAAGVLEDPRFIDDPVTLAELPELDVEVSILSPLEPAASPEDFNLLKEGIYLACQGRTGCFLPQVAQDTGWSREQLLGRLCTEKMGLPRDAWRDAEAKLSKFAVSVVGPAPVVDKPK